MTDPHRDQPLHRAGCNLARAHRAIILLHGRGGTADSILPLGAELADGETALLAPQAAGRTWYPNPFMAPIEQNEPWLSSALARVQAVLELCAASGLDTKHITIAGFSQGACLATEYVARKPAAYGGLLAFTGGLIGPPGADLHHQGSLSGTHALFSSGDPDPHVPFSRVEASARKLEGMGAHVELLRHYGRPHTILPQEIDAARSLLRVMERNVAP